MADLDLVVGATDLPKNRLGYTIDQTVIDNLSDIAKRYQGLITALIILTKKSTAALGKDFNDLPLFPHSGASATAVTKVLANITTLRTALIPPASADAALPIVNSAINALDDFINGAGTDNDVQHQMQLVQPYLQPNTDSISDTDLAQAVEALNQEVQANVWMYIQSRTKATIGQASPGMSRTCRGHRCIMADGCL